MKKLINIIYNCVLKKKEIPKDLLYEFSRDAIKIVQNRQVDDVPTEFWDLQHYVELFWREKKYKKEKNSILIYQMGQLFSYTSMIRDIADDNERILRIREYAERWKNKYLVYKGVHDESGITHKKLVNVSGLSPSALSQFIAQTRWDGYLTYRNVGREKYYYLTDEGEKLYELLKSRYERAGYIYPYGINNGDYVYSYVYKDKMIPVPLPYRKKESAKMRDNVSNILEVREQFAYECKRIGNGELYAEMRNDFSGCCL